MSLERAEKLERRAEAAVERAKSARATADGGTAHLANAAMRAVLKLWNYTGTTYSGRLEPAVDMLKAIRDAALKEKS